ncbi:MAG: DnaA N-terminal domain-containing protein [Thermomicrobiales bacterium]
MEMQGDLVWQTVLGELEGRITKSSFENWLRNTELVDFADDVAVVAAPNTFSVSTLEGRFASDVDARSAR